MFSFKKEGNLKSIVFLVVLLLIPFVTADSFNPQIHSPTISPSITLANIFTNNVGAATYSIPIEVPQGTNELQPTLTLSYNSYARNSYPGIVGSGWSLTESYVQRDVEYTAGNSSDDTFLLVLNGQPMKLVNVSGTFHTETESYMKITKDADPWLVRTKDGTLYTFDYQLDSNLNDYTWRWYLGTITDTHGNNITYNYLKNPSTEDNGTVYPNTIEYNNDESRVISFSYETLPSFWSIIDNGNLIKRTNRLNQIQINVSGDLVRNYNLSYTSNYSIRGYLSNITEYGSDGISSLPSTIFNYTQSDDVSWKRDSDIEDSLPETEFSYEGTDSGTRSADLTRNGKIDFYQNANITGDYTDTYERYLDGFTDEDFNIPGPDMAFVYVEGSTLKDGGVRLGDYNGDGLIDLIRGFNSSTSSSYEIWENFGSTVGWNISNNTFITEFVDNEKSQGVELVDLNGDGYVDVTKAKEGQSKTTWINDKDGNWSVDNNWNLPVDLLTSDEENTGAALVDFNGDGLVDVYISNTTDKKLWLNDGYGWLLSAWDLSLLPDSIDSSGSDQGVRFADLNGDGLTDVIQAIDNTRLTLLNLGEKFVTNSSWDIPDQGEFVEQSGANEGTRLMDIDNDGSIDIVRIKRFVGDATTIAVWVNQIDKPNLLYSASLPSGSTMIFEYNRSSESMDYDSGFNEWVLESVAQYDGLTHQNTNDYASCIPAECPSGYLDKGIDCSGDNNCTRVCESYSCSSWTEVDNDNYSWLEYNYLDDGPGPHTHETEDTIASIYVTTSTDYCHRMTSYSDEDEIIDYSEIGNPDENNYDAVMGLSFFLDVSHEQPWDGNCELTAEGDVMNYEDYYLVDDKDNGDNFNSAGTLGGSVTAYCLPPESECFGYSDCTTECYGEDLDLILHIDAGISDGYGVGSPDGSTGACRATGPSNPTPWIKNITFEDVKYYLKHERATYSVSNNDQVCTKAPAVVTSYEYHNGLFDYNNSEFLGFGNVTETRTDNTIINHSYHQDDARKGLEYKTEIGTDQTIENEWNYTDEGEYYIVKLEENKITDKSGSYQKVKATNYTYDSYGNPLTINHSGDYLDSTDDWSEEFEYTYNTSAWIVDKPKHHTTKNESSTFSEEWFYYDDNGLDDAPTKGALTTYTQWLDTGSDVSTLYEYDSYGNVIIETNARGHDTTYGYDDSTKTFLVNTTNPLNQVTEYSYNSTTGNLLNETDPNGYVVKYTYDTFGRKTKEIKEGDSVSSPTVSWSYDVDGIAPELVKETKKISPTEEVVTLSFYDGFNNLAQTKTNATNDQHIVKDFYYSPLGKIQNESNNYFVSSSESYGTPDSSIPLRSISYDSLGRVTNVTNPDGTKTITTYSLWNKSDLDENNNQINTSFDAFGRVIEIKELNEGNIYTTTYEYDLDGNVELITDNAENNFLFTYDSLGRLSSIDDPDLGVWLYTYDEQGNLLTQTDANGNEIKMDYDELDRVLTKNSSTAGYNYTYDQKTTGVLSNLTGDDYNYDYSYDDRLRLTQELKTVNSQSVSINYTYDGLDRVVQKNISSEVIDLGYSEQGLQSLNDQVNFTYNAHNQPINRTYENSLTTDFDYYSGNQRVKSIATSTTQDLEYQYDDVGNVIEINDSDNTISISYDNLDRVITSVSDDFDPVSGDYNYSYTYDSLGNILNIYDYVEGGNNYTFTYGGGPIHSPSSISIDDTTVPVVTSLWASPSPQGLGENVTLNAEIIDYNGSGDIDTVEIGIIVPGESEVNYSMTSEPDDIWQYVFTDFTNGTYTYTVYVNDTGGQENSRSSTFNMYSVLDSYIQTPFDLYAEGALVNITDTSYLTWFNLTEFNNSKTTENLTFSMGANVTRYLNISKRANVMNATIKIRGYELE